jgi:hypothetical protein
MELPFAYIAFVLFVVVANGVVDFVWSDAEDLDAVIKKQSVVKNFKLRLFDLLYVTPKIVLFPVLEFYSTIGTGFCGNAF